MYTASAPRHSRTRSSRPFLLLDVSGSSSAYASYRARLLRPCSFPMKPHCRRTVLVECQRYTGLSASSYTTPDRRSAETEPSALCSAVCSCFRLPSLPSRCKLRHPLDQSPVLRVPSFWTPLTQLPLHSATPSLCSPPAHSALEQTLTCHLYKSRPQAACSVFCYSYSPR